MDEFAHGAMGEQMRGGVRRRAGLAVLVAMVGMVSACGKGGNTSAVCDDAEKAFTGFSAKLKTISPTDATQWQQASGDLATRLDALAKKSDDAQLKKALADMAGSWRSFSTTITTNGQTARLSEMLAAQPQRLTKACG